MYKQYIMMYIFKSEGNLIWYKKINDISLNNNIDNFDTYKVG